MLDYLSTFTNTNSLAFPNTAAVNSSGGATTDGTEFIASMVNDSMWGVWQALLNYTGQTPNGIVESISNSQILESLRRFETPGKIISAVWNGDPAVLGIRALQLTGQGILRANYTELDDVIYVGDTDNPTAETFYHADDAAGVTRNTAGVYLILPDARGLFVRGLDLTGSVDPNGASRELGGYKDDYGQRITGSLNDFQAASISTANGAFSVSTGGTFARASGGAGPYYNGDFDSSNSVSPNAAKTNDLETAPKSIVANLMITY